MLEKMPATLFARWMAFYLAESQIAQERSEQAALEREALEGAEDIRGKIR
jgi:hypothetical protein